MVFYAKHGAILYVNGIPKEIAGIATHLDLMSIF